MNKVTTNVGGNKVKVEMNGETWMHAVDAFIKNLQVQTYSVTKQDIIKYLASDIPADRYLNYRK